MLKQWCDHNTRPPQYHHCHKRKLTQIWFMNHPGTKIERNLSRCRMTNPIKCHLQEDAVSGRFLDICIRKLCVQCLELVYCSWIVQSALVCYQYRHPAGSETFDHGFQLIDPSHRPTTPWCTCLIRPCRSLFQSQSQLAMVAYKNSPPASPSTTPDPSMVWLSQLWSRPIRNSIVLMPWAQLLFMDPVSSRLARRRRYGLAHVLSSAMRVNTLW